MSLHAFVATRFELPDRTWAARASAVLVVLAAVAGGWVCTHYFGPALSLGIGCLILGLLPAFETESRSRGSGEVLEATADGAWRLRVKDGSMHAVTTGPSSRCLGATVVLDVRAVDGPAARRTWLTPLDVPAAELRRLVIRLQACAGRDPSGPAGSR
jgi:hypothetical protein